MSRWLFPALVLLAAAALGLRVPQLDRRPMHTDEAVHAWKFKTLWESGTYRYDPNEFHGPSLYYATLPFAWLTSARSRPQLTESTLRLVPVVFGVAAILLLGLLHDALGAKAAAGAGVLTAVSPAMVYYSRYYIHEMLLLCFTLLFLAAAWRYVRRPHVGWALTAGAALGLMHATKETFVLAVGAMVLAAAFTLAWSRWVDRSAIKFRLPARHGLGALAAAVLVSFALFSSFFTYLRGPLDSVLTYLPWLGRAGGNTQHVHPWHYYLGLLIYTHRAKGPFFSEGLILLLALVGMVAAFTRKGLGEGSVSWLRFVSFYALLMTAAYSLLPYKTPWCVLGFLQPLILLAGVGVAAAVRLSPGGPAKLAVVLVLVAVTGQLAAQAVRASYPYCADQRNPYVYAHTVEDVFNLVSKVQALAKVAPQGRAITIKIIAAGGDYWPLPWYFREFPNVGCYSQVPPQPQAPVVIASTSFEQSLEQQLGPNYQMGGFFGLRPAVFLELFVAKDLWTDYLKHRPPDNE